MRENIRKVFRAVFIRPSNLPIQREKFSFLLRRSVLISIAILVLGSGLTLISTATTYVSQHVAELLR